MTYLNLLHVLLIIALGQFLEALQLILVTLDLLLETSNCFGFEILLLNYLSILLLELGDLLASRKKLILCLLVLYSEFTSLVLALGVFLNDGGREMSKILADTDKDGSNGLSLLIIETRSDVNILLRRNESSLNIPEAAV
jgi:hypothetical protein